MQLNSKSGIAHALGDAKRETRSALSLMHKIGIRNFQLIAIALRLLVCRVVECSVV